MKTVLLCGKLFTAVDETVRDHMAVIIEGNKIVEVAPIAESYGEGYEVIDLKSKFVMPGIIDAHIHSNSMGKATSDDRYMLSIGDYTLNSLVNVQADLMAGFTTIRDLGSTGFSDIAVKKAIESGRVWGPRMVVCGSGIGSTGGHSDSHFNPSVITDLFNIIDSPDAGRKAARMNIKYGADVIKIMATGGVLSFGDEPGAAELNFEEMKAIIDEANVKGKTTAAHAHGTQGIRIAVEAGITSIEHGTLIDQATIELMAQKGTYVVPTITAPDRMMSNGVEKGIPAWVIDKCRVCYERYGWAIPSYKKAGVKIGWGTDCGTPYSFHGTQGIEFELLHKFGMSPIETLIAATKTNAEILRMTDKIGTLEPGKFADVVAVDKNPLDDLTVMTSVSFVMKDGKIYKS